MTTANEKVLELVSSGKISAAEGDELLKAMQRSKRSLVKLLINPMESMGLGWLLLLSVVGAGCSLWLSTWNVRFDGALDVHLASHSVSLRQAVLDQVFDWPLTTFVLWIVAVVVARQGRLIDFLGMVGAARVPLALLGVLTAAMRPYIPTRFAGIESISIAPLLALAVLAVPLVVWNIMLLYTGYRTASGLRGAKCLASFCAALIFAEVASKLALYWIHL